ERTGAGYGSIADAWAAPQHFGSEQWKPGALWGQRCLRASRLSRWLGGRGRYVLRRGTVAYTGADHFGRDREVDEHGDQAVKVLHVASGDLWAGAEVQIYGLIKTLAREPAVAVSAVLLNEGTLADRLRAEGVETMVLDEQKMPAPM